MKTSFYLYLTLFLVFACVVSCKDDDDPTPQSAAAFTPDKTTAKVGEDIQFTNGSQNATAFKWSFGDGTTSKEVSPKKAYLATGTYTVSLVSTGEGGSTISNTTIKIVPAAAFTVADEDNLVALSPIQFTNASRGGTSFLWEFGDAAGSTSTDENPKFAYLKAGTFTVTLSTKSAEGESSFSYDVTIAAAVQQLYVIDYGIDEIYTINIDGTYQLKTFKEIAGASGPGIAYDDVHGKIYFTDFTNTGAGKIWSVNIDGSDLKEIVTGLYEPYGITVDPAGGKIYWTDGPPLDDDDAPIGNSYVSRANLDGTGREDLVVTDGAQFLALDVDLEAHQLYYYDYWNSIVYKSDLDGGNATDIVTDVWGHSLKVDTKNNKIYFHDRNEDQLKRANLDGSNVEKVVDTGHIRLFGIAIDTDSDKLYWSSSTDGEVYMSNLDGSDQETIKSDLSSPRGIFLRK